MSHFLTQKGIIMKSIMKVTCTALLFTGLMAGCNGNTAPKTRKERFEKECNALWEIVKNEYYRATVENAKFEKNRQRMAHYYSCYD